MYEYEKRKIYSMGEFLLLKQQGVYARVEIDVYDK